MNKKYGLGSIAIWTDAKLESFNVSCAFMSAVGWVLKIEKTLGMMFPASFAVWDHPYMNEGKIVFARKFMEIHGNFDGFSSGKYVFMVRWA